jgi:hypothetical protein
MTTVPERTPEAYAKDVEATRARVLATIDTIQARLQPRALIGSAVEGTASALLASGGTLLVLARKLMRDHPVVTASAGVALGLTLVGRNQLSKVTVNIDDDAESYSDFDDGYAANLAGIEPRRDTSFAGMVAQSPLAAVFAGLAAGALIGALFPGTRQEDRLIGAHRDRVVGAARAAARGSKRDAATREAA